MEIEQNYVVMGADDVSWCGDYIKRYALNEEVTVEKVDEDNYLYSWMGPSWDDISKMRDGESITWRKLIAWTKENGITIVRKTEKRRNLKRRFNGGKR